MAGKQHLPGGLEAARCRFEAWRNSRKKLGPIPETLWDLAVRLVDTHGLNPVAQGLRLNYYDLRRRVEEARSARSRRGQPTFVQVEANGPSWAPNCTVELESTSGAKMTVHLRSQSAAELVALAEAFWGKRP